MSLSGDEIISQEERLRHMHENPTVLSKKEIKTPESEDLCRQLVVTGSCGLLSLQASSLAGVPKLAVTWAQCGNSLGSSVLLPTQRKQDGTLQRQLGVCLLTLCNSQISAIHAKKSSQKFYL